MFVFPNGYPGAISRSLDDVVISLGNHEYESIPFGAPVFTVSGERSCKRYEDGVSAEDFIGFAVRVPVKTPETFGSKTACYNPGEPVDVLTRGSIVQEFASTAHPGDAVYLRKLDGKLVTNPGSEGTTLQLPNCTVRSPRDTAHCAEVVVTKRNII